MNAMTSLTPRGYRFSPHYLALTVWTFGPKSGALVSTSTHRPLPGYSRHGRYEILAEKLRDYRLPVPAFQPKGWQHSELSKLT